MNDVIHSSRAHGWADADALNRHANETAVMLLFLEDAVHAVTTVLVPLSLLATVVDRGQSLDALVDEPLHCLIT